MTGMCLIIGFKFLCVLMLDLWPPARPQPTSCPTVPQENVQARSVLLSWEPGSDGLSPVRYYTVQVRELPEKNWTVHSASVSHESSSYMVDRYKRHLLGSFVWFDSKTLHAEIPISSQHRFSINKWRYFVSHCNFILALHKAYSEQRSVFWLVCVIFISDWSPSPPISSEWRPLMILETVTTVKRVKPLQHYRTVRTFNPSLFIPFLLYSLSMFYSDDITCPFPQICTLCFKT